MTSRRLQPRLAPLLLLTGALGLVMLAGASSVAAVAGSFPAERPALHVTGSPLADVAGIMPGSTLPGGALAIRAEGTLEYRLRASWSGSAALARQLVVMLSLADGTVLYRGPLDGAGIGGDAPGQARRLFGDTDETLVVTALLPLTAGNEVQGASLVVTWTVEASEPAA
jgi:hypothetical protein